ncbi:helix-turn-helix domain-containing protein [Pseudooceanicola marinus]|uniref:AraC-like ligand-binding domain-containing protein n=1 Tax=Pseudooceanicola marinus TaxID=396013 RepID=UPI001C98AE85|nr:helix-turn-helix domain-containing protein [Pseudooceanicola marinus]MBY5972450.1 helix-turn-helix domain-containing protein [Ferrimonas balearica]MCA1335595.1 helix-turn-helix domain-containing protein [Pseudooceanicola marinus]
MQTEASGWQRFSTTSIPRGERLAFWQESANELFPSTIVTGSPEEDFFGSVSWMQFGEVVLADFVSTAMEVSRAEEHIARNDAWYEVCLQVEGDCELTQGGRTVTVRPREMVLYDSQQPYRMVFKGPYRQIALKLPRRLLQDRVPCLDTLIVRQISGQSLPGRFLFDFIITMCEVKGESARDSLISRLESHVVDLLATALSEIAQDQPLSANRQAQLARVKAHILAHLDEPSLCPAEIARSQSISLRSLYELFEGEDLQVSKWIKAQRLERIRKDLGDSLLSSWPITTIALRRGFKDFSHFSRAFRAQYGISPRAYRKSRLS